MRQFGCGLLILSSCALYAATRTAYDAQLTNGFSIHHYRSEVVGDNTRLYISPASDSGFVDIPTSQIDTIAETTEPYDSGPAPAPKAVTVEQAVSAASDKHLIDPDLIQSVIRAESGANPHAVSKKGARGLMQLMPGTASQLGVKDAFEPGANVDAGTRYLRELLVAYNGDIVKALAAYNAGPQRVQQYHGVPPYRETRAYVARVVRDFNRRKAEQEAAARKAKSKPAATKSRAALRTAKPSQIASAVPANTASSP